VTGGALKDRMRRLRDMATGRSRKMASR
jgi:hypothetical protein